MTTQRYKLGLGEAAYGPGDIGLITVVDEGTLLRAIEIYEIARLDFAEAYLVAVAESAEVDQVVSFDKSIDRIDTVRRVEP